ncbi:MAG: Bug family tripartite tricarboxylate transporter substrate binding protein [Pseudomonadota bacterium]|jgi:tripartite-type tricarboxylate transporter receptor subunit TctC
MPVEHPRTHLARRAALRLAAAGALAPLLPATGLAQGAKFPSRTVRMVAAFAPGGALDLNARIAAQAIQEQLGQPAVVENRAGASGVIGTEFVARAAADGHTLLLGAAGTHGINPVLQKLPYDPIRDFAPVSVVSFVPHVLVVNPALPVSTLQEFLQYSRSRPGLTYASSGTGTIHHLAAEMLRSMTGTQFVHVPYKGAGPAMADVVSGQVQWMSIEYAPALPMIKAGKLRPLALATAKRVPGIELPTAAEAGLPGWEVTNWYAVFAPAGTPADVVDTLSRAVARGITTAEARERFASLGAIPVGGSPEDLASLVKSELARWSKIVKSANVKVD